MWPPDDDEFIAKQALNAIAQSYWRKSASSASSGDYESAVRLVDSGLKLVPDMLELSSARADYVVELRDRAVEAQVSAPQAAPTAPVVSSVASTAATMVGPRTPALGAISLAASANSRPAQVTVPAVETGSGVAALPRSPAVVFEQSTPALTDEMGERIAKAITEKTRISQVV